MCIRDRLRPSNTVGEAGLQVLGGKLYGRLRNFCSAAVFARRLPKTDFDVAAVAANLGLGIELESYSFDKYRTDVYKRQARTFLLQHSVRFSPLISPPRHFSVSLRSSLRLDTFPFLSVTTFRSNASLDPFRPKSSVS